MDAIHGLLRIKTLREEGRERELRSARHDLEQAMQALRTARQTRDDRQQEHRLREEALYRDVMSRPIVVRELDDLHAEIVAMKAVEQEDDKTVEKAEDARTQRRATLDSATSAWRAAAQACDKFRDLHSQHVEWQRQEEERQAGLELEDLPVRAHGFALAELTGES